MLWIQELNKYIKCHGKPSNAPPDPCWHGTTPRLAHHVCQQGTVESKTRLLSLPQNLDLGQGIQVD